MTRTIGIALCVAAMTVTLSRDARGGFKSYKGNWDITNDSNESANDFHVTVKLPGGALVQKGSFYNDGFFDDRKDVVTGGADVTINLDWKNTRLNLINPGDPKIHIGYDFRSNNPNIQITSSFWTLNGTKTKGAQPTIPGFEDGSFHVTNHSGGSMTIDDMNFLISPTEVPLSAMLPYTLGGFGTSSGIGTFVPSFVIPDGGAVDVTSRLPGVVGPTDFLLVQWRAHATGSPGLITAGMFEVQGPIGTAVPEPSTLGTALLGLVSLTMLAKRRHCRS